MRKYEYDVALSFAGEDRQHAEALAELLKNSGYQVFYDEYEQAQLWGKDLYTQLSVIYKDKARYCVMFLSEYYARKLWTNHERESAQARAFMESEEYILPVRLDDTEIPGISPTVGYLDLRSRSIDKVYQTLVEKLPNPPSQRVNDDREDMTRNYWAEFREYCDNERMSLEHLAWNRHTQYYGFRLSLRNVSDRDIWLAAWRDPQNHRIAVNLHFRLGEPDAESGFDALGIFDALKANKIDIEAALDESLTWQRDPRFNAPGPLVGVYENITPARGDWQRQFEWIFTTLETLNRVFSGFIRPYL